MPRLPASYSICLISSLFRAHKYVCSKVSTTVQQKRFSVTRAAVPDTAEYSSTACWGSLLARMQSAAVILTRAAAALFPKQSVYCLKLSSCSTSYVRTLSWIARDSRKQRRNNSSSYNGTSATYCPRSIVAASAKTR